jgi:hypothetical protein
MGRLARAVAMVVVFTSFVPSYRRRGAHAGAALRGRQAEAAGLTRRALLGLSRERGEARERRRPRVRDQGARQAHERVHTCRGEGGCASTGDAGSVTTTLDAFVGDVATALADGGTSDGRRCAAVKLKAAGKKTATKLGCHARAVTKVEAADPTCLAKAEAKS